MPPRAATVSDASTSPLIIRLFGPFEVQLDGVSLPPFRTRKAEWLLALLALRAGVQIERDWLAGGLWPDSPEAAARANLRSSLRDVRQALGPEAGRLRSATTRTVGLDLTGARVDVLEFDGAMACGAPSSLEQAVALYRGPLLEGCVEEWAFQERQVREQAYLAARERLAARALAACDPIAAERHLRAAVSVDPFRESAHRTLMEVLDAAGNPAAALQVYRDLHDRLRRELHTVPDPATTGLAQRIRAAAARLTPAAPAGGGGPAAVPPLTARPNNLPAQPTPLIGREHERATAGALLRREEVRLLTLTGPGGTGKTRLGLQIAADLLDQFADGVYLVELAPIRDPGLIASAVVQALGVREETDRPPMASLKAYLREKHLLLLLDNFEHLLAAASVVTELLAAAPRLKVLVTSRAVLHLRGEHEFPVPPLAVPDLKRLPPSEALSQYAAVALFIQRALAVRPSFRVTNENAPAVAEICHRLDGLPLAIELAAARIKLFSPQALLPRLEHRLSLLTGGAHDLPARQQTLRDAIAWSYDLLTEREQRLFRRLSIFAGGCIVEAVEAVCSVVSQGEMLGLEELAALVDQSLLQQEDAGRGEPRFTMLETIREYAQERLRESGEAEVLQWQHGSYFLRLAEAAEAALRGTEAAFWLERLETEHDNLRAALAWAIEREEAEIGLQLIGALAPFWTMRAHWAEGEQWVTQVLALPGAAPRTPARAAGLRAAALLAETQGDAEAARTCYYESLAIARECGDQVRSAQILATLGDMARRLGQIGRARPLYEESLVLYRELDDQRGLAGLLMSMGLMGVEARDFERARALLEESRAKYAELGDAWGVASTLVGLGTIAAVCEDDLEKARRYVEECLAIHRRLGARAKIASALYQLADVAMRQGCAEEAEMLLDEALGIARELPDHWWILRMLMMQSDWARRREDLPAARAHCEEALAIVRAHPGQQAIGIDLLPVGRVAHQQGDYEAAWRHYAGALAAGWELLRQADASAVRRQLSLRMGILSCLEGLASVAAATGGAERAARLFGAAAGWRNRLGLPLPPVDATEHERYLAGLQAALGEAVIVAVEGAEQAQDRDAARAALGEEAFVAAWEAGRAMPLESAVAYGMEETP
jgi:predicted ATPase/DNA-binding SARP family transcriptional activator